MKFTRGGDSRYRKSAFSLYVFIALVLISFSALFFSVRSDSMDMENIALGMFSGLRNGIYEVSSFFSHTIMSIQELASLRREYSELVSRVTRYEQLERSAAEIMQENFRLREQLGFSQNLRYRHVPAEIIGRDPDNLFSALVINKGSRAGVAVNMPVIAYHNGTQGLVGRVINTGFFESLIMPLYDTTSYVSARLTDSRFEGIVEGRGSPESPLLMRFISRRAREEIYLGDNIITSGIGGVYPSGINMGRVSRINYQETELSMELELSPAIDFSRLEFVFVLAGEIND